MTQLVQAYDAQGKRYYTDGRDRYESVTNVLGHVYGYDHWTHQAAPLGEYDSLAWARHRGKVVHEAVAILASGKPIDWHTVDDSIVNYVQAFENWRAKISGIKVMGSELAVRSNLYHYAGCLDLLVILDGDPWLIDVKTGQRTALAGPQTAAYRLALCETELELLGLTPNGIQRAALYLRGDGTFEFDPLTGAHDFNHFANALNAYRSAQALGVW